MTGPDSARQPRLRTGDIDVASEGIEGRQQHRIRSSLATVLGAALVASCSSNTSGGCPYDFADRVVYVEIPAAWTHDKTSSFELCFDGDCHDVKPTVADLTDVLSLTAPEAKWRNGDKVDLSVRVSGATNVSATTRVTAHPITRCNPTPVASAKFDPASGALVETKYTFDHSL